MTRKELEDYRVLKVELRHTEAADERKKIETKIEAIEKYIKEIPDTVTRTIFKAVFQDGVSQARISREINYNQSQVSRRISNYLKDA